jgi:hypothetical protein
LPTVEDNRALIPRGAITRQSGSRIVVDVDLQKFFDQVDHDIDRLEKRLGDPGVIRLIQAYLDSGIMDDGVVQKRTMGTPKGGAISPQLANVLLDEVDTQRGAEPSGTRSRRLTRILATSNFLLAPVRRPGPPNFQPNLESIR